MGNDWNAINVRKATKTDLNSFKDAGETYDEVVMKLIVFRRSHADCARSSGPTQETTEAGGVPSSRQVSPGTAVSPVTADPDDLRPRDGKFARQEGL